jgi:phosphate transport system permease protein
MAVGAVAAREEVRRALTGRRRDIGSTLFQFGLLLTLILALCILLVLLGQVVSHALPVLRDRGGQILSSPYSSLAERAGVRYGIIGSLYLMLFVVVIAFPLGIGAAVYMEEYARDSRLNRVINANIRNLAGVPAIVYGIFGLAIFVELLGGLTSSEGGWRGRVFFPAVSRSRSWCFRSSSSPPPKRCAPCREASGKRVSGLEPLGGR